MAPAAAMEYARGPFLRGPCLSWAHKRDYRNDTMSKGFFPGYMTKKRYLDKLGVIGRLDPYETVRSEWQDYVDPWSPVHVHFVMYLLVTPSPYSGEELKNYRVQIAIWVVCRDRWEKYN